MVNCDMVFLCFLSKRNTVTEREIGCCVCLPISPLSHIMPTRLLTVHYSWDRQQQVVFVGLSREREPPAAFPTDLSRSLSRVIVDNSIGFVAFGFRISSSVAVKEFNEISEFID